MDCFFVDRYPLITPTVLRWPEGAHGRRGEGGGDHLVGAVHHAPPLNLLQQSMHSTSANVLGDHLAAVPGTLPLRTLQHTARDDPAQFVMVRGTFALGVGWGD